MRKENPDSAEQMLHPNECPPSLRFWANEYLLGSKVMHRGVKSIVAGWRWDGISDEVMAFLRASWEAGILDPGEGGRADGGRDR